MKLVRPNMTVNWSVWDWNDPNIRLVAVDGTEGRLSLEAALKRPLITVVIPVINLNHFGVEFWLWGTSINWETCRLWDIGHVAYIYFGKVDRFVPDG